MKLALLALTALTLTALYLNFDTNEENSRTPESQVQLKQTPAAQHKPDDPESDFALSRKFSHKTLTQVVEEMSSYNRVDFKRTGIVGRVSDQYKRFLFLCQTASEADLLALTRHESPPVRVYALVALGLCESAEFTGCFERLSRDTAGVLTMHGDIGDIESVLTAAYSLLRHTDSEFNYKLQLSSYESYELDSILLTNSLFDFYPTTTLGRKENFSEYRDLYIRAAVERCVPGAIAMLHIVGIHEYDAEILEKLRTIDEDSLVLFQKHLYSSGTSLLKNTEIREEFDRLASGGGRYIDQFFLEDH